MCTTYGVDIQYTLYSIRIITLEKSELIKNSFNDIMKKLKIECLVVVEAMYSLWHTAYGQGVSPY